MRETVIRAKQAQLAELSAVALFKRLRKSKDWLYGLCCALFEERGCELSLPPIKGCACLIRRRSKNPARRAACGTSIIVFNGRRGP